MFAMDDRYARSACVRVSGICGATSDALAGQALVPSRTVGGSLPPQSSLRFALMRWGSDLLIASEPAPGHVDAAIVLQGSVAAEKARIAGSDQSVAARRCRPGLAERSEGIFLGPGDPAGCPRLSGTELRWRSGRSRRFCETGGEVNSTLQEAQALRPCIHEHHWQSIVIVTSDYHTRRAGCFGEE